MGGFDVDVGSLTAAGQGIKDLINKLDRIPVDDVDCDSNAVGHGGLAEKLESFCGRWQIGVENLAKDGGEIAQRLLDTADAYRTREESVVGAMGGDHG